jgi:hypothetical protein
MKKISLKIDARFTWIVDVLLYVLVNGYGSISSFAAFVALR